MAGRAAPVPPFVDLPSLPRPQVVDDAGFELTDEQIEALAARVGGEGVEEDNDLVEAEESAQVSVADGEAPEERHPLLSLDQSLVLQYSILKTRYHHMRHLLPLIFTHPPVPAHNRPRLRPSGKKEFVFPTPAPPPQPLPSAEYHGPSTKEKKKKAKGKEKETDNTTDADKDKDEDKSGDESEEPKKGKKKEQLAPAHEIECISRVTLQVGPMSFPNTELWVARFVPPRQGSAATVRGRLKSMAEPRKPKEPKPKDAKEPKEKVRKERALPRMSIDGGPAKRPRTEKPKVPTPTPPLPTAVPAPPPNPDAPPRFTSRQDIPQALIQRVNAAATRHPWLSVLIHKAARSVASKDELAKLGRVVARLGRGEDVGEGPDMPGVPVRPPNAAAGPSRPPPGAHVRPLNAVAGPSRPPANPGVRPPMAGVRPPNVVAGPVARPGAPLPRPPATAVRLPVPGTPVRPTVPAMPPPAPATHSPHTAPPVAGVTHPPAHASSTSRPVAAAPSLPAPPAVPSPAPSTTASVASAPSAALPPAAAAVPAPSPAPAPAPAPLVPTGDKPDDSDSDVDMSGLPQVGGGWGDEPDSHSDSDWDADVEMRGRPQVGGGEGAEPKDEAKDDDAAPASNAEGSPAVAPAAPVASASAAPAAQQATPNPQAGAHSGAPVAPAATATGPIAPASSVATSATTRATVPSSVSRAAQSAAPAPSQATPAKAGAHPPPAAPTVAPATPHTVAPTSTGSNVRWFPISGPSNPSTPGPQRGPARPFVPRPSHVYTVPPYQADGPQPPPFLLVAFKGQETDKFLLPLGQNSYLSRVGGDYVTSPAPTTALTAAPPAEATAGPADTKVGSIAAPEAVSASTSRSVLEAPAEQDQLPVEEVPRGKKRTRASMAKPGPNPPAKPSPKPKVEEKEKEKEPTPSPKDPLADMLPMPGQHPQPGTVLLSTYVPIEPYTKPDWPSLADRLPFHNPAFVEKMKVAPVEVKPEPLSPKRALRSVREVKHPRDYVLNVAAEEWLPEGPLEPITIRLVGVDDRTWARMKGIVEQVEKTELDALVRAEPGLAPEVVKAKAEAEAAKAAAKATTPLPVPTTPAPAPGATIATPEPAGGTSGPATASAADATTPAGAAPSSPAPQAATTTPSASAPATPATPATPALPTPTAPAPVAPPVTIPALPPLVKETWLARKKSLLTSLLSRVGPRRFPRFRLETTISAMVDFTSDKWAPRPYHLTTRPLYARDVESDDEIPVAPRRIELSPSPDLEGHSKKRRKEVSAVTFEMPVSLDALDERVEAGAARGLSKRGRAKGAAIVRKFPRGTAGAMCEGCAKRGLKVWRRGPGGRGTLCNDCGHKFSAGTLGELKAPGAASQRDSTPGTPVTLGEEVKVERAESTVPGEGDKEAPDREQQKDSEASGGDSGAKDKTEGAKDTETETPMDDESEKGEAPKESTDIRPMGADTATEVPVAHDEPKATATTSTSPDPLASTIEDVALVGEQPAEASAPPTNAMDVDP
ncbi:uncharacterized protein CcaverHIS019_0106220 [Cutaneotrichosporon cavernicola]|uniref:GATA-type domain-containing protein n=1 Tax=Cutaneotrichosporon cavernicola TaxID=279322 RepID=A0AA48KX52_9TREE|nr:uncharacterized protein CcaverHIS019_0106220 [Cutaneotrichosporon cavernicola]BEI87904.1 hypothetical protein CcaverHIS019_0106220 [Cutaneotrichosporon cavernicola]BEI95678.1 hypothetical protein CcaverHIS631_0106270 [Cutaneotrichosporon cavernicola]BEJ03452.1 hypothetical protein CcaverHIS641_0106270 [Cutaneotrichosporon cavernicola]